MLRACLASRHLGIGSLSALIVRLNNDPALRSVAGFTDSLPSYATFWRVFDRLAGMPELIARCCDDLLDRLAELAPDLGQEVAVDATTIEAYANPNRKRTARNPDGPADADASWTKKNSARDPSQQEWVFGYKAHVVADAKRDVPLDMVVATAKSNDSPFLLPLLKGLASSHSGSAWRRARWSLPTGGMIPKTITSSCIGTAGFRSCASAGCRRASCITPSTLRRERRPVWAGREMAYVRTDSDTGHHLYRCPEGGCPRRDTAHAVSACDDESWENPEDNIRLFGGAIRRGSPEWKAMYGKRWSVERVFSRWKEQGLLERHCYFGLRRVSAHARLQMLMSLAAQLDRALAEAATARGAG